MFESTEFYTAGGGGSLTCKYALPFTTPAYVLGGVDYYVEPVVTGENLSMLSLNTGGGVTFFPLPVLGLDIYAAAGYYQGFYRDETGGNPMIKAGLEVSYFFHPAFSLGAGASYNFYFSEFESFLQGINTYIGATYHFGKSEKRAQIKFNDIDISPVFPVFSKYYDKNPLGTVTLENGENGTIREVKVSFFVKQYMDSPKVCAVIREMEHAEEKEILLYALFTDNIMTITEATKAQSEIKVEYIYMNKQYSMQSVESIDIFDRNAMVWDDDRKAASFVTSKDPDILSFSKNIAGIIRADNMGVINLNFRLGMGILEALKLYGINYTADPKTPFARLSESNREIDFLQFPVQTMQYKAGDCDDLSILYCALLESIGIETGFITIPGHIYMAFSLDIEPVKAKKLFLKPDDLIFIEGRTWLPVEITLVNRDFLNAWEAGAREWCENREAGTAQFINNHDAWQLYMPAGISGGGTGIGIPENKQLETIYNRELQRFIDMEIQPRVKELNDEIRKSNNDPRVINKLGILYASYGLIDKAEAEFLKIASGENEFTGALINLGNIYFIKNDYKRAIIFFERAYQRKPDNPFCLTGLLKSYYESENYERVKELYLELESLSPNLAKIYEYMVTGLEDSTRESSLAIKEGIEWDDE